MNDNIDVSEGCINDVNDYHIHTQEDVNELLSICTIHKASLGVPAHSCINNAPLIDLE